MYFVFAARKTESSGSILLVVARFSEGRYRARDRAVTTRVSVELFRLALLVRDGLSFVRRAHGGEIGVPEAHLPRADILAVGRRADGRGHAQVVRQLQRQPQVLLLQVDLEVRRVVAYDVDDFSRSASLEKPSRDAGRRRRS